MVNVVKALVVLVRHLIVISQVGKSQPLMVVEWLKRELVEPGYRLRTHQGVVMEGDPERRSLILKVRRSQVSSPHGFDHRPNATAPVFYEMQILQQPHQDAVTR